jgi:hypothetical protein
MAGRTGIQGRTILRGWRRLLNVLLLPVALVLVVFENVLWAGARFLLHRVLHLAVIQGLRLWLAHLPGWAALPMFLVPEGVGRMGEVWSFVLLYRRHAVSATLVYILVRIVAMLIAVFIYQACEPELLRIRWFARTVGWLTVARDRAVAWLAPLYWPVRALARRSPRLLGRRLAALRRCLDRRARQRRSLTKTPRPVPLPPSQSGQWP